MRPPEVRWVSTSTAMPSISQRGGELVGEVDVAEHRVDHIRERPWMLRWTIWVYSWTNNARSQWS